MTMPRTIQKQSHQPEENLMVIKKQSQSTDHPLAQDNNNGNTTSRQISASGAKQDFTSPSGVLVGMDMNSANSSSMNNDKQTKNNFQNSSEEINKSQSNFSPDHTFTPLKGILKKTNATEVNGSELGRSSNSIVSQNHAQPVSESNVDAESLTSTIESLLNANSNKEDPKNKPATMLFFLHGVGGSSDVWHAQMRHFARLGFEIVAPDLIGHGFSSTPKQSKAYHFNEIVADMEELFDRYCKKRNIVIGHSYG